MTEYKTQTIAVRLKPIQKKWLQAQTARANLKRLQSGLKDTIDRSEMIRQWLYAHGMPK